SPLLQVHHPSMWTCRSDRLRDDLAKAQLRRGGDPTRDLGSPARADAVDGESATRRVGPPHRRAGPHMGAAWASVPPPTPSAPAWAPVPPTGAPRRSGQLLASAATAAATSAAATPAAAAAAARRAARVAPARPARPAVTRAHPLHGELARD